MEFKKYKLYELASVDISSVDKKSKEGEKPVRLCNFTDVYKNWAITRYHYSSLMEATAKDRDIDKFSIRKGQVAITKDSETRDDIGIPTYIADDFEDVVLGYHCALITPNDNLDGKYLNAYLNSKMAKKYFEGYASGSGQRYTLTLDSINEIQIWAPDIDSQGELVKILSDLDKKIALSTRMNSELEAMAKQLYDYWFVQFDFPDENGKPYKSSGGKMVYNEKLKREIPEGWDVKRIGDYANIFTGKKDVSKVTPGDYLFFSCAPDPITSNDYIYDGEVVLVSGNGSYTGRTTYYKGKCDLYQRTYACVLKEKYENYYPWFYQYMKNYFEPHYSGGKHGSAIPYIILSDLTDSIIVSRNDIIKLYSEKVRSIFNQIYVNHYQIIPELTQLRDSLLPMLMNGQVTVE